MKHLIRNKMAVAMATTQITLSNHC